MSEPDFLYKPGENTAFRASLVEHWPSHYKKEMTGKLYMQSEPVMVNGLIEAETNATASVAGLTIDVPDTLMVGQSQAFCENFRAGRIHVSAPAPSGQAWGWAIVDKNGDEVDTRARFTAFFGAVNHEEEPFDAEWLASRDREFPGLAPHRVVTLYTSPQPAGQAMIPAGWSIVERGQEIQITSPIEDGPGGKYVTRNSSSLSDRLLYALAKSLLAGQAAAVDLGCADVWHEGSKAFYRAKLLRRYEGVPASHPDDDPEALSKVDLSNYSLQPAPAVERGVEDEQKEFKAAMKKLHHFALPGGSLWDTADVIEKSLMFKAWRAGRSTAGKEQA